MGGGGNSPPPSGYAIVFCGSKWFTWDFQEVKGSISHFQHHEIPGGGGGGYSDVVWTGVRG